MLFRMAVYVLMHLNIFHNYSSAIGPTAPILFKVVQYSDFQESEINISGS